MYQPLRQPDMRANARAWRELKARSQGGRAWVLGGGASLKKAPLEILQNRSEPTFAVNGIGSIFELTDFRPTYYCNVLDSFAGAGENLNFLINNVRAVQESGMSFLGCWNYHWLGAQQGVLWLERYAPTTEQIERNLQVRPTHPLYSIDVPQGVNTIRSLIVPIQIADYLGYDPIVLIGCDGVYTQGHRTNHFTENYVSVNDLDEQWEVDHENKMQRDMHQVIRMSNTKIVNATVGGVLDMYPRADALDLLGVPTHKEIGDYEYW